MPKKHPLELKAAVMASLLMGNTVGWCSKVFGVPKQTVSRWNQEANNYIKPWPNAVLSGLKKGWKLPKIGTGPFDFSEDP